MELAEARDAGVLPGAMDFLTGWDCRERKPRPVPFRCDVRRRDRKFLVPLHAGFCWGRTSAE
jgi:hypothetical protein